MRPLLFVLACLALGLATFTWRLSRRQAPALPIEPEVAAQEPDPSAEGGAAGAVEPAADRGDSPATAVPGARPKGGGAHEDRAGSAIDDPDFARKYAGWTLVRLEERLAVLEQGFVTEVERLCDLRFDAGQYRVVDAGEVEGLDDSYDVLSTRDAQGVETRSRTVALELPVDESSSDVEARLEYQIVTLPPEVYPDLYRQRAELDWLRAHVETRRASGREGQ